MKRIIILAAIIMGILCCSITAKGAELRGVWVSSVFNLDYPSAPGLSKEALIFEADAIVENAKKWGFNAIFLQVRPSSDALYNSNIFPFSQWVSGESGKRADKDFDPLAYFIEKAHGLEIEVHAWINPYRITRAAANSKEEALAALPQNHPALELKEQVVFHTDGCLYFDPGTPEARKLIVDGIMEIVENYAVDGIHMDDYFYPSPDFADGETFSRYGGAFDSVGDFRRASVNQLVSTINQRVKEINPYADFGISPFGVWANATQRPDGSDTAGDSSYFSHFADSVTWINEKMIDYIMPQLYWPIGSEEADFETLLRWWESVTAKSSVKLYIGMAPYRTTGAEEGSVWYGANELIAQHKLMENAIVDGFCYFRYASLLTNTALTDFLTENGANIGKSNPVFAGDSSFKAPFSPLDYDRAVKGGDDYSVFCSAPKGSAVHALTQNQAFSASKTDGNLFEISVQSGKNEEKSRPIVACMTDGALSVEILPGAVKIIDVGAPASITRITFNDSDNGHSVTFFPSHPVVARAAISGTILTLTIDPCKTAVLFEDNFFEHMELISSEDSAVYRFLLPVSKEKYTCQIRHFDDSFTLIIK